MSKPRPEKRYAPGDADLARGRVAEIVAAFPEGSATLVNGLHLRLEVRGKRFGWCMEDHHGDGRLVIECKAPPGLALSLVGQNPAIYHVPSYAGARGWIGAWLDAGPVDWDEIRDILWEAYATTAPKSLLRSPWAP